MKNKKQLLFALGLTVILFLMIISASYLIFSISKLGKEKKTVKSGIMLMNYTGLNNTFSINKTFPTMDKDGKNSKDYYFYLLFSVHTHDIPFPQLANHHNTSILQACSFVSLS